MDESMAETEKSLYIRPRECKFDASDLPIIQNLFSLGYDAAEIGMILGYTGSNWKISAGKTLGEEARKAIEQGLQLADAQMVANLAREAQGYEYTEVKKTFNFVPATDPETKEVIAKRVQVGETHTTKRQPGNAKLAELLVVNRLPELFKKISEVRKSEVNANITGEMSDEQIDKLVGRLLSAVEQKKIIEAEVIDNEV